MRTLQKLLILSSTVLLVGCKPNEVKGSSSSIKPIYISSIEHTYKEVEDKFVLYSNMFGIAHEDYYVYFFSRTCSHCESLKSFIIPKSLERNDIYFIESSNEITLISDASKTIGLSSIEEFGIEGYPSLIKIKDKKVEKNIPGTIGIKNELTN